MTKVINLDCDGTFINLYGVNGWLDNIINEDVRPYREAKTMVRMSNLARLLNRLQTKGYVIGIVSWLAKNGTNDYNAKVTNAKKEWLHKHLTSVHFDEIHIVEYGTPKETVVNLPDGILFDDEKPNRENWLGIAYDECNILEVLRELNK